MERKFKIINNYIVYIEYNECGTWGWIYNANGKMISGGKLADIHIYITCEQLFEQYPPK